MLEEYYQMIIYFLLVEMEKIILERAIVVRNIGTGLWKIHILQ